MMGHNLLQRNPGRRSTYILMIVLLLLNFVLIACQNTATPVVRKETIASTPLNLLTPGVLTIGSYINYEPQEYIDPQTKKLSGFDIDLITLLAQRLHLRQKVVPTDFSALTDGLLMKHFDVAISAITITPELQKEVDFITYFRGGESLLVQKGDPLHLSYLHTLCGLSVGVMTGTVEMSELIAVSNTCQKYGNKAIAIVVSNSSFQARNLLLAGKVVAIYQDSVLSDYFAKLYPNNFVVAGPINNMAVEGIALRKDDIEVDKQLTMAFQGAVADGSYHRLILKWGLTSGDITVKTSHP